MIEIIKNIVEQGLIFSLVLTAVFLTSKIIRFDDLTVEGSFGIGGAAAARLLLLGINNVVSLGLVLLIGAFVGLITGLIHTKLKVNNLISGIVVTTALYSVCLKIAGSHLSLGTKNRLLDPFSTIFGISQSLFILVPLGILTVSFIKWLLQTEIGFFLRATGENSQIISCLGKSSSFYKILGLCIANALTALAGALFAQYVGFFSITSSLGILVISLAGLALGEVLGCGLIGEILLGSIAYPTILALIFEFELDPVWNKLAISVFIVLLLLLNKKQSKNFVR